MGSGGIILGSLATAHGGLNTQEKVKVAVLLQRLPGQQELYAMGKAVGTLL
jgi:hypothetical protein